MLVLPEIRPSNSIINKCCGNYEYCCDYDDFIHRIHRITALQSSNSVSMGLFVFLRFHIILFPALRAFYDFIAACVLREDHSQYLWFKFISTIRADEMIVPIEIHILKYAHKNRNARSDRAAVRIILLTASVSKTPFLFSHYNTLRRKVNAPETEPPTAYPV